MSFLKNKKLMLTIILSSVVILLFILVCYNLNKDGFLYNSNINESKNQKEDNNLKNENQEDDSTNNEVKIDNNKENINDEQTKEEPKEESNNEDDNKTQIESDNKEINNEEIKTDDSESNDKEESNEDNDSNNTSTENNESNEFSYANENVKLTQEIARLYQISVLYDDEAEYFYNDKKSISTGEDDAEKLNETLKTLKSAIGNIPQSILDTLRIQKGYHILIVKELPEGESGLAVYTSSKQKIILDVDNRYQDKMFYHETFHIMDRYMKGKNGGTDAFVNWRSYNPTGFEYSKYDPSNKNTIGTNSDKYTYYDKTVANENKSFISKYAKTDEEEDRAEIFADLMFRSRKYYYMESGYGINEKAKYLDEIIDQYFGNIPDARWEKWISK